LQDARKPKPVAVEVDADVSAAVVGVQRGDTLWKLSAFYLGRGDLWASLWKANPQLSNPNLIHPGQLLRLPDATQLARHGPSRPGNAEIVALSSGIAAARAAPNLPDAPLLTARDVPPRVKSAGLP
jgi:LysM repeat protein